MLEQCPECKKDISTNAMACPHCGYSRVRAGGRKTLRKIAIVLIYLLLCFSALLIGGIGYTFLGGQIEKAKGCSTLIVPYLIGVVMCLLPIIVLAIIRGVIGGKKAYWARDTTKADWMAACVISFVFFVLYAWIVESTTRGRIGVQYAVVYSATFLGAGSPIFVLLQDSLRDKDENPDDHSDNEGG